MGTVVNNQVIWTGDREENNRVSSPSSCGLIFMYAAISCTTKQQLHL